MYDYKVSYALFNVFVCVLYYKFLSEIGAFLYITAWLLSYVSLRWKDSRIREYLMNKHYPGVHNFYQLKTKRGKND